MARPPLEVADLVRAAGDAFIERNRHWLRWKHIKVLLAIRRCRTAALGGHLDECTRCGHRAPISYNSCRDRHCPKCQDRKSTRLNSSHITISYAVFCLKKKKITLCAISMESLIDP